VETFPFAPVFSKNIIQPLVLPLERGGSSAVGRGRDNAVPSHP